MSFKREGNDKYSLNILRQRRVKDLLAENIPQDEATLLSNGRLACIVCTICPVFDTVNMLTIHRHGKKHQASVLYKEREKQELKNLIIKRKHEQFLKDGTTSIQQAPANDKGLWSSKPYDPRVKKHKLKPYDRKPTLNLSETQSAPRGLDSSSGTSTVYMDSHPINQCEEKLNVKHGDWSCETNTHNVSNLPGNRDGKPGASVQHEKRNAFKKKTVNEHKKSKFLELITMQQEGPVKHSPQLSKIFEKPGYGESTSIVYHPYRRNNDRQFVSDANSKSEMIAFKKKHSPIKISMKKPSLYQQLSIPIGKLKKSEVKPNMSDDILQTTVSLCPQSGKTQCQKRKHEEASANKSEDKSDNRKRWQLGGSGWRRDWDGKWIKDEEAEFDSDEEPPNL